MTELSIVRAGDDRLSCPQVERAICEIWSGYFGRPVGPYDDFFDLGGDSVGIFDVVAAARERGIPMRGSDALRHPTPARLAERLTVTAEGAVPVDLPALRMDAPPPAREPRTAYGPVPIGAPGTGDPVYVVHSDSHVALERAAVARWNTGRPVRGLRTTGAGSPGPGGTITGLVGRYLQAVRREQPCGPYRLVGFGSGAVVAYEMARQLRTAGEQVARLVLINAPDPVPNAGLAVTRDDLLRERLTGIAARFGLTGDEDVVEIHGLLREDGWYDDEVTPGDLAGLQQDWVDLTAAGRAHPVVGYDCPAVLVDGGIEPHGAESAWQPVLHDLEVHRFSHGVRSPRAVLDDPRLALVLHEALAA